MTLSLHWPHWPPRPQRPAAPSLWSAPARRVVARPAARRPHPRLAVSRPLRWQTGYPEPSSPAPRRSQLALLSAVSAGRDDADRTGGGAAHRRNAAHGDYPGNTQRAAERPGRVPGLFICRAGRPAWRGWRAGRVPALAAQGGVASIKKPEPPAGRGCAIAFPACWRLRPLITHAHEPLYSRSCWRVGVNRTYPCVIAPVPLSMVILMLPSGCLAGPASTFPVFAGSKTDP